MRKLLVLGNCQADALSSCLKMLSPLVEVRVITFNHFSFFDHSPEKILEEVAAADHVVCQSFEAGVFGSLTSIQVRARAKSYLGIPNITFNGYHPDIVFVIRPDGGLCLSPMDTYHSALILYGFAKDYSVEEIASLFCDEVFHAVGYYSAWGRAQDALLSSQAHLEIDIVPLFRRWMRVGCFMHTSNHPKLFVIEDIAKAVLDRLDLPAREMRCTDFLTDVGTTVVWGVYPPLASRFGIQGSYTFKRTTKLTQLICPDEERAACFDLDRLIRSSLAAYVDDPGVAGFCERIRYWGSDATISAALER